MEATNKRKKILFILLGVLVAAGVIALLIAGSGKKGGEVDTSATTKEELTVAERSLLMQSGETKTLTVKGENVTFTSSDEKVATVDANGVVQAVGKGNALISVTADDTSKYCGVIVDYTGTMVDITKQKASKVLSEVQLADSGSIEGFAVDFVTNAYYFSQPYTTTSFGTLPSDVVVSKVTKNSQGIYALDSWMRFYESGTGRIAIEKEGIETNLLLESNGTYYGSGSTMAKIKWENEGFYQGEFGTTYELSGVTGSASPAVDADNNLLMIYDNSSKNYLFYDRKSVESGEATEYLHQIKLADEQTPVAGTDESQGFYNASVKGFALANGYIYQVSGNSSIYVSVFDLNGTLQYCYRVPDYADMEVRTPGGIAIVNGHVYLAVGTHSEGYYFADVWKF